MRRYAPGPRLPRYRHRPGHTPHPRTHPQGHSFGTAEVTAAEPLCSDNWHGHPTYLYGVDLYNWAYWWEAHEYWEALWRLEERDSPTRLLLQGLIQMAAARLKEDAGNDRGRARLWARSRARLRAVMEAVGPVFMGLDIEALQAGPGPVAELHLRV